MKKRSKDILTSLNESYLEPKYDSAQSFYNKAMVDDSGNKLYSYGTLVAEVVDDKPVIHNAQSATTVRHIKDTALHLQMKKMPTQSQRKLS